MANSAITTNPYQAKSSDVQNSDGSSLATKVVTGMVVTDSPLMFRNRIINGNCLVSQRGAVSAVNNAATYGGADRFFVAPLSFTTVTAGSINKSALSGTSSGFGQWLTGFTCTGSGTLVFGQRIESQNTLDLNSKQVTFTGVLYQNTGNTVSVTVAVNKANAVDNFTGVTTIGSTSVSVASGVNVSFSLTVTLGSADANNGLSAEVTFTGLSNITTKNFAIGDFQLEAGPTATPFERRPIGVELGMCQRYYERLGGSGGDAYKFICVSVDASTTSSSLIIPYRVEKRIANVTFTYSGSFAFLVGAGTFSGFFIQGDGKSTSQFAGAISGTGFTTGAVRFTRTNNDANAFLAFDAELL